jgi:phosphoglucosamine mutase
MQKFPQTMINVRLSEKVTIDDNKAINLAVAAAERELGDRGRVLLRPSGTEPLIRIMAEGEDQDLVRRQVEAIAKIVDQQVG